MGFFDWVKVVRMIGQNLVYSAALLFAVGRPERAALPWLIGVALAALGWGIRLGERT